MRLTFISIILIISFAAEAVQVDLDHIVALTLKNIEGALDRGEIHLIAEEVEKKVEATDESALKEMVDSEDSFDVPKKKAKKSKKKRKAKKHKKRGKKKRRRKIREGKATRAGKIYLEFQLGYASHGTPQDAAELMSALNEGGQVIAAVDNYTFTDNTMALSFGAGYFISNELSVELFYSMLGTEEQKYEFKRNVADPLSPQRTERPFNVIDFNGKYTYWFNPWWGIYAGLGVTYWMFTEEQSGTVSSSKDYSGVSFNGKFGGEYYFGKNFFVGGGAQIWPSIGNDESGTQSHWKVSLNLGYLFR